MLWYKNWLETRFRIVFMLLFAMFPIALHTLTPLPGGSAHQGSAVEMRGAVGFFALYYSIIPLALAGSGIKTQSPFRATKGLHGSMYFTLSLPVSRFQLLAARVSVGMLETILVLAILPCAIWTIFPPLRNYVTGSDLLKYWLTVSICAFALHFLGVLLSTVLDDLWQNWTSIFGVFFLRWILSRAPLPESANIFRAMGESSPLFTHSLPWTTMGFSLAVAAVLFLISMRVVERREY
ncbi:MAG: hypothetical protein JO356_15605 [Acidobacteria bacterium]|nr:hypothetical protein [Acidobacteriota bacterium]